MKKWILITLILIFGMAILPAYAGESQSEEAVLEASEGTSTAGNISTSEEVSAAEEASAPEGEAEISESEKEPAPASPPPSTIEPADGGYFLPFPEECFQVDLATGAAMLSVPIIVPPGRKKVQPDVALNYSSNNSNGICGMGWLISNNSLQRSIKRGVPEYDNTDIFILSKGGANIELADIGDNEYRTKIESDFMRYAFTDNGWITYDKSGTKYIFGPSGDSRIENGAEIFAWYIEKVEDVRGNYIAYTYMKDGGQIYLKKIEYTGGPDLSPDKSIEFEYEERPDKKYSYRTSWLIKTEKRLKYVSVKLNDELVWLYKLDYILSGDTSRSLLHKVTIYDKDGEAGGNSLPPKVFTYQELD